MAFEGGYTAATAKVTNAAATPVGGTCGAARGQVSRRRRSFDYGRMAEASVAHFLRAGGYQILAKRVRAGQSEVDLIASRDDTVAFVEVKARRRGCGLDAVTPRKQARISAAADVWLSEHPHYAAHAIRFDIALVSAHSEIDYMENAFESVEPNDFVW
jgi:putative endonuclease